MSRQERPGISDPRDMRLEPGKVRCWLEGRAPEQVCGTSTCWGACPLAMYLREAHDADDIRVGEHTYRMLLRVKIRSRTVTIWSSGGDGMRAPPRRRVSLHTTAEARSAQLVLCHHQVPG